MAVTIRNNDRLASNLVFGSLRLSTASILLYPPQYNPYSLLTLQGQIAFLAFVGIVRAGFAFGIRAGYGWLRILYILYTVPSIARYLTRPANFDEPITKITLVLLAMTLHVWAIVLIVKGLLTD